MNTQVEVNKKPSPNKGKQAWKFLCFFCKHHEEVHELWSFVQEKSQLVDQHQLTLENLINWIA